MVGLDYILVFYPNATLHCFGASPCFSTTLTQIQLTQTLSLFNPITLLKPIVFLPITITARANAWLSRLSVFGYQKQELDSVAFKGVSIMQEGSEQESSGVQ